MKGCGVLRVAFLSLEWQRMCVFNRASLQLHSRWINHRLGKEAHQLQMMHRTILMVLL